MAMRCIGPVLVFCMHTGTLPEQGTATPDSWPCIPTLLAAAQFIAILLVTELCMGMVVACKDPALFP